MYFGESEAGEIWLGVQLLPVFVALVSAVVVAAGRVQGDKLPLDGVLVAGEDHGQVADGLGSLADGRVACGVPLLGEAG